jgi:UPF0716 protein FxsA
MVFVILALAFIVMPLLELFVFVQVGQSIGFLNTLVAIIVISLVGAWLARREGAGVLQRIRQQLDAGRIPTDHLIDGALILTGGLLLLLPGFISDAMGLLVLFPPTRALLRNVLRSRFRIVTVRRYNGPFDDGGPGSPPVIDV